MVLSMPVSLGGGGGEGVGVRVVGGGLFAPIKPHTHPSWGKVEEQSVETRNENEEMWLAGCQLYQGK